MKRIVIKMTENKLISLAAIALFLATGIGIYTVISINKNVAEMTKAASETVYYFPKYPPVDIKGKDAALIKRGEYLSKAGDCIACHTNSPKKGTAFAGGLPMVTPFGTIYSPNITPDKETGIGSWTEEQFIKAMRKGISPKGKYYFPAFPYYYFNKISTNDLKAIKAYLDSLPAVKQQNLNPKMIKPFNQRFLQLGWRALFFRSQENINDTIQNPKQSLTWNRGAYFVEGLGHCAMCHSPSYHLLSPAISLGAPIKKYNLTGAKIQGYLAPNISKTNLSSISLDEIVKVFTEDRLIGGGKVEGPMLEVNHNSLSQLTHEDQYAIATYLKTVVSQTPKQNTSGGPGAGVYEGYCAGCHATGSGSAPKFSDAADWAPVLKKKIDVIYTNALHGLGGMPAKGTCNSCSELDIKQAVDYMLTAAKGGSGGTTTSMPKVSTLTMTDGKHVYESACGICHSIGFKGAPKLGDKKAWEKSANAGFLTTYENIVTGRKGHIAHGACPTCSDAELKAAVKYMLQQSTNNNYELW